MMGKQFHSVKALIYSTEGLLLLQLRDNSNAIPFPNTWTLFGGHVENGESLGEALKRELLEEIGLEPGLMENELFQWISAGSESAVNHIYPIKYTISDEQIMLSEGQGWGWFHIDELCNIKTTPLLFNNIYLVKKYIEKILIS